MAAGDLTTLASVKAWLGITDNTSDGLLAQLITAASDFIQSSVLQRQIASATYTEQRLGNGSDTMVLRQFPITGVTSVAFDGQTVVLPATGNPPVSGYLFDNAALILVGYCFPYRRLVTIVYQAGFASTPPAVVQACNELVGEAFERRRRIGQASKALGNGETVSFDMKAMNANVKQALMAFEGVAPV